MPPAQPGLSTPDRPNEHQAVADKDLPRLLTGLGLATAMQFYTFDSVNLILPDMAGDLGVSRDESSWTLIVYSSALMLSTPLSSYFARRLGLRSYIVSSIILFAASSIACSLSTSFAVMLFFRAVEGFAGGALNFWWRGSVYVLLSGPKRSKSMMHISVMLYGATALGLLSSGYLIDHLSWRFLWVLDVTFALPAVALILRYYPQTAAEPDPPRGPADWLGVGLLGAALIAAEVTLSRGEIDGWFGSPLLVVLALTAAAALALFVARALDPAVRYPVLRLSLVADRNVLAAVSIGVLTGMIISGAIYALPEYLRRVDPQERSASQVGLLLCVYAVSAAGVRPLATQAINRFGQRRMTVFALLCLIVSMTAFSSLITTGTPAIYYALPLVLYALCLAPLLSAVGSGTAARVSGAAQMDAVSMYMTCRQFGATLGIALVNSVLARRESWHSSRLFDHIQPGRWDLTAHLATLSAAAVRAGRSPADAGDAALGLMHRIAEHQASVLAFADAFRVMGLVGVLALAFTPLMSPPFRK